RLRLCLGGALRRRGARRTRDADLVLDLRELAFLDALDLHDVFGRLERTIRTAILDDGLRLRGTDAREPIELLLGRRVDVDGRKRKAGKEQRNEQQQDAFHHFLQWVAANQS